MIPCRGRRARRLKRPGSRKQPARPERQRRNAHGKSKHLNPQRPFQGPDPEVSGLKIRHRLLVRDSVRARCTKQVARSPCQLHFMPTIRMAHIRSCRHKHPTFEVNLTSGLHLIFHTKPHAGRQDYGHSPIFRPVRPALALSGLARRERCQSPRSRLRRCIGIR